MKKIRSSYRLNKGDIIKTSVFINNFLSNDRRIKTESEIYKKITRIDNDLLVINKPFNWRCSGRDRYKKKSYDLLSQLFQVKK